MKKFVIIMFVTLASNFGLVEISANDANSYKEVQTEVELNFYVSIDVTKSNGHYPKLPVSKPEVYQDNYILYLVSGCDNTTITLSDEFGNEYVSTTITEGTTTLCLPQELEGHYFLTITRGIYVFSTYIEL